MAVDTALYPAALNTTIPTASDFVSEGDDNFRQIKTMEKTTWGNVNGAVTASHTELNHVTGVTSSIQTQLNAKAPTAGPTFTGTVTLPSTTSIGTVSDVELGYLDGATSNLQTQINAKGAIAGQTWTGSHSYTGATITVPTVTIGDATNNAASTAFVAATSFSSALPGQAGNAEKFVQTDGSSASWQYGPAVVTHTANGNLVVGKINVATVAGITLTVPAGMSARDPVDFMNCSTGIVNVSFGSYTVKGQTPDSPILVPARRGFKVTNTGSTLA